MIIGLNIPTTYRIGRDLLTEIAGFGFTHVRVDVPPTVGDIAPCVSDYIGAPVVPCFLLHDVGLNATLLDAALNVLPNFWLQVWNEPPGMDRIDLPTYTQGILAVHHDARARGFTGPILMGGLANPGAENRAWLSEALLSMPADVWVDEHRYAYKAQDDWARPWPRYATRSEENRTLRTLAGGRPCVRTEIGWHTAVEHLGLGPFGKETQLSDQQATQNYVKDLRLYESDGLEAVFVFQLNDGPTEEWSDRQGIRTYNTNQWKPQAQSVRLFRGGS